MREIDLDTAGKEVEQYQYQPSQEQADLMTGLDEREQKSLRFTLHYFVNKLKLKNPTRFLEDVLGQSRRCEQDFSLIARYVSKDTRLVDVGCGWGRYSKFLAGYTDNVFALDHVYEHCVATKYLTPTARVFHGDARELDFESETFDITIAKDLIEHVGDSNVPFGASGDNLRHQYRLVQQLARITKFGGHVYLSTGNYRFPWDGENNLWFYHWLDEEEKLRYNQTKGISSDKYWLLTWEELQFIVRACGLEVQRVTDFAAHGWGMRLLTRFRFGFPGLDSSMVQIWRRLITTDPRFCSCWFVVATKRSADGQSQPLPGDRCLYARATGLCCHAEGNLGGDRHLEETAKCASGLQSKSKGCESRPVLETQNGESLFIWIANAIRNRLGSIVGPLKRRAGKLVRRMLNDIRSDKQR